MAPKRATATAKSSIASKTEASKDVRWVHTQLGVLAMQKEAGPAWLDEHHTWHEEQLEQLLTCLSSGIVETVPQDVRDGLSFYLSQNEDGQEVDEDEFYIDRELYCEVFAARDAAAAPQAPYTRSVCTEEQTVVAEGLENWCETSVQGVAKFQKLLAQHAECAAVQEAGLTRLSTMLAEARAVATEGAAPSIPVAAATGAGFTSSALTRLVVSSMGRFPRDAAVQKVACVALRNIVVMDAAGVTQVADAGGARLSVMAIKAHVLDLDVCRSGAAVLYAMVQKTGPASQERLALFL